MENNSSRIRLSALFGASLAVFAGFTLALIAGIILAAKPNERRIRIYSSVEACRVEQPADDCAKAFAESQQQHEKSAPHMASRAACEAQYGNCDAMHDATGDWFIPAMAGFMLGHALAGGVAGIVSQPVYIGRDFTAYTGTTALGSYRSRCAVSPDDPYCRANGGSARSGGFVYAANGGAGRSPSSSVWSSRSYNVESVRTTVMRGGFGSSASSAPASSMGAADAPNAISSSSVARGGFGSTASAHGVGE